MAQLVETVATVELAAHWSEMVDTVELVAPVELAVPVVPAT